MKRLLIATALFATASIPALAQTAATSPEQEVRQAYKPLFGLQGLEKETAIFESYVADDALFVMGDRVTTKQEVAKRLSEILLYSKIYEKNRRVVSVAVQGSNAVVVENIWVVAELADGKKAGMTSVITNVLRKRDQSWQLVAQTTGSAPQFKLIN